MASAVRHLQCLAHTWIRFALRPSGHWPRSAPEIRFAAIRNRRNPDSCDLSLPTPTSISLPPSRQNAASPKHPAVLDARANRSGARPCLSHPRIRDFMLPRSARSCLSRACIRDFTHPWRSPILPLACSHSRLHASLQCPPLSPACPHPRLHASLAAPDLVFSVPGFPASCFLAARDLVSRVPAIATSRILSGADLVSRVSAFATSCILAAPAPVSRVLAFSIAVFLATPEPVSRTPVLSIAHFVAEPFPIRAPNRVPPTRANINYSFAELLLRWRRWRDGERRGTTNPGNVSCRDGDRG
jgi:hypothetical protein